MQRIRYVPCFATITLDTASGTLVPAARKVMPITESGILSVSPGRTHEKILCHPCGSRNLEDSRVRFVIARALLYSIKPLIPELIELYNYRL